MMIIVFKTIYNFFLVSFDSFEHVSQDRKDEKQESHPRQAR
jgi:hypothetical protein